MPLREGEIFFFSFFLHRLCQSKYYYAIFNLKLHWSLRVYSIQGRLVFCESKTFHCLATHYSCRSLAVRLCLLSEKVCSGITLRNLTFCEDFLRNNFVNKVQFTLVCKEKVIVKILQICIESLPPYITKVL